LDNGSANLPVFGGTEGGLGILRFMNGFFNGCMDQNSPYACFSGKGAVVVTAASTSDGDSFSLETLFQRKFKFRGVRNATGTFTPTTTTSTTTTSS
jgi:hypothetical protein